MEDKCVDLLYDYIKFHIGLNMTLGSVLVAILLVTVNEKYDLQNIVTSLGCLVVAMVFMTMADFA